MKLNLSRFNPEIQRTEYLHLCSDVPDALIHADFEQYAKEHGLDLTLNPEVGDDDPLYLNQQTNTLCFDHLKGANAGGFEAIDCDFAHLQSEAAREHALKRLFVDDARLMGEDSRRNSKGQFNNPLIEQRYQCFKRAFHLAHAEQVKRDSGMWVWIEE